MSITYSTYVGPYVRCVITLVEQKSLYLGCANPACEYHRKRLTTKFCQACGKLIESLTLVEIVPSVDQWDVSEELDQKLSSPTGDEYDNWMRANLTQLWLPNWRTPWRDGRLEEREDFALVPIATEQIANEVRAFQEFFATELAALVVQYGAGHVRMEWGVIQDYS